ncbi:class I SAM-dependent DNA methyltransferase [Octadecabacter sp. R77987]|uniref:class I SAM-dependent DNA methyltransferase n=1 Tax=Octadecabacter sp. R77987 TaxID=3093874 RepID=UPI003672B806
MADDTLNTKLWKPRSVEDTIAIYRDWAADYDADVLGSGYVTPTRAASALGPLMDVTRPVLDFGCGTGLSGMALAQAGFTTIDGTDITPEMLALAQQKGIYRKLFAGTPGALDVARGSYDAILAAGVVSLGAAPPDTLDLLIDALDAGGLLAFSFNDPTLADSRYTDHLARLLAAGTVSEVHRDHGPHLPDKGMGSDVIVLRRS